LLESSELDPHAAVRAMDAATAMTAIRVRFTLKTIFGLRIA
jgi:hypothetical protein